MFGADSVRGGEGGVGGGRQLLHTVLPGPLVSQLGLSSLGCAKKLTPVNPHTGLQHSSTAQCPTAPPGSPYSDQKALLAAASKVVFEENPTQLQLESQSHRSQGASADESFEAGQATTRESKSGHQLVQLCSSCFALSSWWEEAS